MSTETDVRRGWTSASGAPADDACPGKHLACRGLKSSDSEDASFGRIVHAALAKGSDEGLDVGQADIYESCKSIEASLVNQCFGPDAGKCKVFREERFWVKVRDKVKNPNAGGGPSPEAEVVEVFHEHSGQPDVVYRHGPRALVINYKTLTGAVAESAANLQVRDEVVLAAGNLILTEVMAAIVQPLVTHSPELVLYDETSIKQAEGDMFERVRRSNNPESPRIAGALQCQFCLAKSTCKEYAAWAGQSVPATMSTLAVPVAEWTPEQRAIFCERKSAAQKWLDDCEAELKKLMESDPDAVPGYHLKPGSIMEPVNNPQELWNRFSAAGGTLEQFMGCVGITKGKLEEAVRTVTKSKGKALSSKVDAMLDGITDSKRKAPSIAKKK